MPGNPLVEKQRPAGQGGSCKKSMESGDTHSLPAIVPSVNLESSRLWSVFRRYARDHRRIARLVADNEILLERMKQIQGVAL
ncbi:hypothetical protein DesfrDRAFT_1367 [Solidesulfovibrio fructosivorans JJ]]|uniref:Uncharacterized protein n=1 Tax=Solidesulfovibrio fructosivorans JJ] TaxID=596151 RepID=E1JUR8_SOLFR|nr:hypothetical protein [Solidesulfovibrio fructosivorans]EFL51832.1 hypothetical protein DesfrDRAFT_1367 [Solidesulfovibrio fructosivorans JJ]]